MARPSGMPDPGLKLRSGRRMFLDPRDARAVRLVQTGGRADTGALATWSSLVHIVRPTTVIDVGANYGEFLLTPEWRPGTELVAIEANPGVASRLLRSLATCDLPHVVVCTAVGSDRQAVTLVRDSVWSGRTSTRRPGLDQHGETIAEVRLDDLSDLVFRKRAPGAAGMTALVKVDVEGNEADVLRGAAGLLRRFASVVLLVEVAHLDAGDREWMDEQFEAVEPVDGRLTRRKPWRCDGSVKDVVFVPRAHLEASESIAPGRRAVTGGQWGLT